MNPIKVEPTGQSPRVIFNAEGPLLLEGRSLPEDVKKFYDPLIDFCRNIVIDQITIDINLDYFNTASSKIMLELLLALDMNNNINKVQVNWHYEEGDEDSVEMAEIYEEECINRSTFKYIEHPESVQLSERTKMSIV